MALKLQDLIDIEQFQLIQDRLNRIYSFPSAIIDNDGRILTATAWQEICTEFHRKHPECEKECVKSDQYIIDHIHEANPAVSYRCPHGLIDNATPIVIEGVHYGNFFTGQFFLEPPDLDLFRAQAKRYGFDEAAYLEAVRKVPVWSREQLESYLFFIKGLIEVIAAIGLKNLREIEHHRRVAENEERHRTLLQTAMDGFMTVDLEGRILEVNDAYCRMSGYSAAELLAMNVSGLEAFESAGEVKDHAQRVRQQGGDRFESRHRRRDGSLFDVEVSVQSLQTDGRRLVTFLRDITARKRAEEALRESEERYRMLVDTANEGIWSMDADHVTTYVNPAMARMLGYEPQEMLGKKVEAFFYPEDLDFHEERMQTRHAGGDEIYERRFRRRDGTPLWTLVSAKAMRDPEGRFRGSFAMFTDITDRKRAEEERRQFQERLNRAEKMEALGTLAGGVAHDLNNILGIVVGYAEMLLEDLDGSGPQSRDLQKILEGGQRSAAIVQDLLTLARRGVQTGKVVSLNDMVAGCQETPEYQKLLSANPLVRVETRLEPALLNIVGSPVHLAKSFMNLVTNALESMPGGGTLSLATENRSLDRPVHGYDAVHAGDYAVLTVTDTGEGISDRDIPHIFEPFYTKKVMGKSGTGLGLAVVWGTLKDHSGYIDVRSEVGKGTTFTLYFPVTREERPAADRAIPQSEYIGSKEMILVVDDIPEQREMAARLLGRLNYRVATAASGEEALEFLRTGKADLMVLDMIMEPGMDGLETYRAALAIHPGQKAIIVSGYSETDRVAEARALGAGDYLRKPYVIESLGLAVRRVLDGRP
jgi:PAS domain S-box-containing protein